MKSRIVHAAVGLAVLVAAVVLSPAPAMAIPEPVSGPWLIEGEASHKCVDVPNSTTDSVAMEIYTCGSPRRANQQWKFVWKGNYIFDWFQIVSVATDQCLNVWNARMDNNISVIQYPCQNAADNDQWALVVHIDNGTGRHWYDVMNRKSSKCLTVANLGVSNGSKLVQFDCNAGLNQSWTWYK